MQKPQCPNFLTIITGVRVSNVNIWGKKLYIIYQLINYQSIKVKDLNGEEDVFRKIVNMMPTDDCRYALYDCSWESKDSPKEDLVFIMW